MKCRSVMDEIQRLTVEYLDQVVKVETIKSKLMQQLYETAMHEDTDVPIAVKLFTQYLTLMSDGDITFECEVVSNEPHTYIGYTSGPSGKMFDDELQTAVVNFCHKVQCPVDVDFNLDPEIYEGRATFYFSE